jgi:hypothetical protein
MVEEDSSPSEQRCDGGHHPGHGHGGQGSSGRNGGCGGSRGHGNSTSGGSKRGSGPRFTQAEVTYMLETIEAQLPIGQEEWEEVASIHSEVFPTQNRDPLSIRRKFMSLCNKRQPTGDPNCPAEVRAAKRIRRLIEHQSDATNLQDGDEADLALDDVDEEESNVDAAQDEGPTIPPV